MIVDEIDNNDIATTEGCNRDTEQRASQNGTSTREGVAIKDLKLRLPRVYGMGNVKQKKTANFKKNKIATKTENICEREEEERQNVELDESCSESDHEPGASIEEEREGKRMILKARNR